MSISGTCSPGKVWRRNAPGALGTTRWRRRPRIFTDAAPLLFGDAAKEARAALPPPNPPARPPAPKFIPAIDPPRYSGKATVALTRVGRPLYIRPALLACRVGRKFRARTLRRDEHLDLSAQIRAPNRGLNATKFRHLSALPVSTDVYIGDM